MILLKNIKLVRYVVFISLLIISFGYGVVVAKYRVFPFFQIKSLVSIVITKSNSVDIPINNVHRVQLFEAFYPAAEVVFVGDSITAAGEWSDFFPEIKTSNRGISGDKASDVRKRIDSILSVNPQAAFLMIGINDIYSQMPTDVIIDNYGDIISALKENGISVVVQSTIQCQPSKCGYARVAKVNELNEKLKVLAKDFSVHFLFLSELSTKGGLDNNYTVDGIHLNALGYREWVKDIKMHIIENFE